MMISEIHESGIRGVSCGKRGPGFKGSLVRGDDL